MKPSMLLRNMRSLGSTKDISDKVLRTLWLEKMPDNIKNILIVSDGTLETQAAMADKIVETNPRSEQAVVNNPSTTYASLMPKICSLEQQIASMQVHPSVRPRHCSPHRRSHSRRKSRKRFDPAGKYCFFHFKYGKKCGQINASRHASGITSLKTPASSSDSGTLC